MNWNELLDRQEVQALRTSRAEIDRFRDAVKRDLGDATVTGLSLDRRYAILYNAALQLASMLVRCSGYRVTSREGHHALTFDVLTLLLGKSAEEDVMYFQACRAKRHLITHPSLAGWKHDGHGILVGGGLRNPVGIGILNA